MDEEKHIYEGNDPEEGFMPHVKIIDMDKSNKDENDDENIDPTFFEFQPVGGPEGMREEPMRLVKREEWGALPPLDPEPLENFAKFPIKYVIYTMSTRRDTCTTREECEGVLRRMQKRHMEEGHNDIAYNFIAGDDGHIYEGTGFKWKSSRLLKYNPALYGRRIDIAFIGDFYSEYSPPLDMLEQAWHVQKLGIKEGYIRDNCHILYNHNWRRRLRQARRSEFPTAEEWLHQKEHPPDEFDLEPIWHARDLRKKMKPNYYGTEDES